MTLAGIGRRGGRERVTPEEGRTPLSGYRPHTLAATQYDGSPLAWSRARRRIGTLSDVLDGVLAMSAALLATSALAFFCALVEP